MQIRKLIWLMLAPLAAPMLAHGAALDEIKSLNEEISVLTLKAQKAELMEKLNKASAKPVSSALPALPALGGMLPPPGAPAGVIPVLDPVPTVIGTEGLDGKVSAMLQHPNGSVERVETGVITSDGWVVTQISRGMVVERKGKAERTLFVGAGSGQGALPGAQTSGVPGMPQMGAGAPGMAR